MDYGANPPQPDEIHEGFEWQIGKTLPSVQFVIDARKKIASGELSPKSIEALSNAINAVKDDNLAFGVETSPENFLRIMDN